MANAGIEHLNALATIVPRLCDEAGLEDTSLVVFPWIRNQLTTVLGSVKNAWVLPDASNSAYAKYEYLFESTSLIPAILAGRGAIESVILKAAAESLRNNRLPRTSMRLEEDCKSAFRMSYAKAAAAGSVVPTSTHRLTALLMLSRQLSVSDYTPLSFESAVVNAKSICPLIDVNFRDYISDALEHDEGTEAWFQLGLMYTAALQYLAANPDVEALRSQVESKQEISSTIFPFLNVAISCFNEGSGWKRSPIFPPMEQWLACRQGEDAAHRCVAIAHDIRDLAAASSGLPSWFCLRVLR
jgi:hypothetical protein